MISEVEILKNNTPAGNHISQFDFSHLLTSFSLFKKIRFKADVARGTFGKVTVERLVTGGSGIEPIFEFNLHKVRPLFHFFLCIHPLHFL